MKKTVNILIFLIIFPSLSYAVEGFLCSSNGGCYAFLWSTSSGSGTYPISRFKEPDCGTVFPSYKPGGNGSGEWVRVIMYIRSWNGSTWSNGSYTTSTYMSPPEAGLVTNWFTSRGMPPSTEPSVYWPEGPIPGTCASTPPEPCFTEREAKRTECGGDSYVDWTNWSDESCSGAVCCPSGNKMLGGQCIPLCPYISNRTPNAINNYGVGLCVDPPCGEGEILQDGKCVDNCTPPEKIDVSNGKCFIPVIECGPCETQVGDTCLAPAPCPTDTYRNSSTCECTDNEPPTCGMGMHWNGVTCVKSEIVRCDPGFIKNQDGDCMPAATAEPTPTPDPEKTPEENALPYLAALKKDSETSIKQANDSNAFLAQIDSTTSTINDNLAIMNKNQEDGINHLSSKITESSNAIIDAIEGIAIDGFGVDDIDCPSGYTKVGIECKEVPPDYSDMVIEDSVNGYSVGSYNERYASLVETIKLSPVASMINFSQGSIGSGSSNISYDLGENFGGPQTFDFAEFSNIWSIFRSVLLIVFSFIAVRIVILKK